MVNEIFRYLVSSNNFGPLSASRHRVYVYVVVRERWIRFDVNLKLVLLIEVASFAKLRTRFYINKLRFHVCLLGIFVLFLALFVVRVLG